MSSDTLLLTVQQIKDRTGLHSAVDEKQVRPDIKYCQDAYILPLLGTALMNKLQDDIEIGLPTGNYLILWRDYLIDALTYYVLSESPNTLTFQLYNKGLVRKSSENTINPDTQDIINEVNRYKKKAEFYGQKMADYLLQHYTLFTEYRMPGVGIDIIHPDQNSYTTTFFIRKHKTCNKYG